MDVYLKASPKGRGIFSHPQKDTLTMADFDPWTEALRKL
jgi:hypothetical protein